MASTAVGGAVPDARRQDWPPLPELAHRPLHRAMLGALGSVRGARLLDVGCGVGLLLCLAESRGARVSGVDTAGELLEIARWALPDADLRVGDPRALPFADDAFDVATAGSWAEVAELVRVVRPGGRLVVGGRARPADGWAREFGARLGLVPGTDQGQGAGPAAGLRAAGLNVLATGEVGCRTAYPTVAAAWGAVLGSERVLVAIRVAGERAVRDAFASTVAGSVEQDGSVQLGGAVRYAVAAVPGHRR
ncbi:class I SAM-dependent methyltransferase [Actinophytocola sediminis]